MLSLEKIEHRLLQLALFLVPANLSYHWYIDSAYLNGRLIDYLLPKLYLSDLPILLLILIGIYKYIKNRNKFNFSNLPLIIFCIYLIANVLLSGSSSSSWWYLAKIIEFILFGSYLVHFYTRNSFFKLALAPILLSILLQSSLGLYQYISQKSLIGYTFLGESDLSTAGIARSSFFGFLEVVPYGTTPHPNVLAGYLCISLVLFLLGIHLYPKLRAWKALIITLISLSVLVVILSGSVSALSGAILIIIFLILSKYVGRRIHQLLVQIIIYSSLIVTPLFISSFYHTFKLADNHSVAARYELNQVAFSVIKSHPLEGIGLNQFTKYVPQLAFSGQRTLFVQPNHHIGLLIWSEIGFIGLCLICWLIYDYNLHYQALTSSSKRSQYLYFLPLVCLVLIGSLDHYPLTLQTGQLLTTLALTVPLLRSR